MGQNTFQFYFSILYHKTDQEDYKENSHNGANVVAFQTLEIKNKNFAHHKENFHEKGNIR